MTTPVIYDISIGKHKPHSGTQTSCPFCHRETLTDILDEKGDIIWLMNKYPVFRNTYPTVIIESAVHEADLTEYTKEKARQVISFGLEKWNLLERDPRFRSVIYFRNYGPESGGSQRHPHSQIIGLEDYDYKDNIDRENFLGTIFHEDENCFASLSSYPICGMGELNVTLKTDGCTDTFADTIQKIANYILHDFPIPCNSYNLFFYHMKHIHVKLFPRYIASPLYMGYRITHVMDDESSKNIISMLTSPKYFG
jgi:diadenosine tetraphosphate (Ap4A) HIT family hydrolase